MNRPGSSSVSMVTVAFTPDMHSTTAADRPAGQSKERNPRPRTAPTSGSTAHGASIPGSAADEADPLRLGNGGQSANPGPARTREAGDPMRSASASLSTPPNPTTLISASQS